MKKEKNSLSQNNPYQFYINNNTLNSQEYHFKTNKINTRKYNWITFIPHALLLQFVRPANIYFLVSAVIQCIPQVSPLSPVTAILPIVFVLSVSLIREAIEDYQRGKYDRRQNNEITMVYRDNKWTETISGDLRIGELVLVHKDSAFPADLIIIDSELNEGICYIETATLDGEKSLKLKESPKETADKFKIKGEPKEKINIEGIVITDPPNQDLYLLSKIMKIKYDQSQKEEIVSLNAKQLLLKGAKLKNTKWIIGIVVYIGHDCKIMKNAKDPVTKYSSLERLMNFGLIFIFTLLFILCIIAAILRGVYYHHNNLDEVDRNPTGFGYTEYRYAIESFLNFFTYVLLLNTLIPISLIITVEIVKLLQGVYMYYNANSYSHLRKKWLKPNSVSLNEECGLVNYIFSDKTGTLTCNKMEFKYCVIGDICYQYIQENHEENEKIKKEEEFREEENIVPFQDYDMYKAISGEYNNKNFAGSIHRGFIIKSESDPNILVNLESSNDLIENYWLALALCNSCSVHINDEGEEEYISTSPDNVVLVKAAKSQGWAYEESGNPNIKRVKVGDAMPETKSFEKLQIIEFSSDRKRETIIVKSPEGKILLYCKGADSIIEKRLSKNSSSQILSQSKNYVDKFSAQGLRTLFIAMKVISKKEYTTFDKELKEAMMSIEDKDKKVNEVCDKIEQNLYLIGTTIVEDKLQSKVPETIRDLRLAKIKIWMLTGDKMNTAYNIGLSCNLISKNMKIFNICGIEPKKDENTLEIINKNERDQIILDFGKEFNKYKGEYDSMKGQTLQYGILVDEKALLTINEDYEIQKIFLDIAKDAVAVICCRVSPLQKSQVVKMMKNFSPNSKTLAIGDGGNDVSMIMEAHIGVGIYGEEGMRAVQSSDYAIGEFRFLHSLLLFHGRTNYMRNAECILYFFYKNFVFTFLQFIFGFYCNFTGQTIIDDWYITLFNLLFTSLPLGARALLDHDVKPDDGEIVYLMLPFLYLENRENPIFTIKKFFLSLVKGTVHSLINFFWVIYVMDESFNEKGKMGGLWFCSLNLFTNILIIVSIDLLIYTKYHTLINVAILIVITFISYIIFLILVHNMTMFNSVGTIKEAFLSKKFWMNLIFVGGTCGIIDFFVLAFEYIYNPSTVKQLQILLNKNSTLDTNNINDLPKKIKEKIEIYNDFQPCGEEDNLKKETTQRNFNNNEDAKLKLKNGSSQSSSDNINYVNKNKHGTNENKLIKKRKYQEIGQNPSVENSNNYFMPKKTSENTNINSSQKKNDSKVNDLLGTNDVIYYGNQEAFNIPKKKEEDNHSRSVLINNKKGCVDEINSSLTKQNNNRTIYG